MAHTGCVQLSVLCPACGGPRGYVPASPCQSTALCYACEDAKRVLESKAPADTASWVPSDPNEILSVQWPKGDSE